MLAAVDKLFEEGVTAPEAQAQMTPSKPPSSQDRSPPDQSTAGMPSMLAHAVFQAPHIQQMRSLKMFKAHAE